MTNFFKFYLIIFAVIAISISFLAEQGAEQFNYLGALCNDSAACSAKDDY